MVTKMIDPEEPPKPPTFKTENIKKRYKHAKSMAEDALKLPTIERIEKYSFASLFTGEWGERVDTDDSEVDADNQEVDPRLIGISGIKQHSKNLKMKNRKAKTKKLQQENKLEQGSRNDDDISEGRFHCLVCTKELKNARGIVANHLRKHRLVYSIAFLF